MRTFINNCQNKMCNQGDKLKIAKLPKRGEL